MIVIGLTGSIAMGKTTVASMFTDMAIPVFNADAAVRDIMRNDEKARQAIYRTFKTTDKNELAVLVFKDVRKRQKLESILHPLVAKQRKIFLDKAKKQGKDMAVLDIPLLFETELDKDCDVTVVVTAPPDVQKSRAMARGGMTEDRFNAILNSQMPDVEKQARADHVIVTHISLPHTMQAVRKIVNDLRKQK
jgi:dephospho-CoA kinase